MFGQSFWSGKLGAWLVKLKSGKLRLVSQKLWAGELCPHPSVGCDMSQ